jgi:hypothetical protein
VDTYDSGTFISSILPCLKNLRNPWGMHGKACMHTPLPISAANLTLLHKQRIRPHRARLYIRPAVGMLLTHQVTIQPNTISSLRSDTKLKLHYRFQFCCDLCSLESSKVQAAASHLHSVRRSANGIQQEADEACVHGASPRDALHVRHS